jgi:transitional endoplasmic reticulum ATPase
MPLSEDVNLDSIADKTYGFVGADISSLCRQAAYQALRRIYSGRIDQIKEYTMPGAFSVTAQDFETALVNIKPSAMREVMVEIPRDVSWNSVGGLDDIKAVLIENIVYGIQRRETFLKVGIKPAKGMVLSGPPGTGKTLLAKVVARESGANVITIRGPEIRSKWFGESEEKIRLIFAKAREVAPCILLFDEIDAVAPVRGRDPSGHTDSIVNQLLAEMDGIEKNENIFVIGTTNKPELLDTALLRPGRLDYQIFVPLPDAKARRAIFSIHLKDKPVLSDLSLEEIIHPTEGFSCADVAEICRLATLTALREKDFISSNIQIELTHLQQAIEELNKTKAQLKKGFGL